MLFVADFAVHIRGAPLPYPGHYCVPQEVQELTERQQTASKKQAHIATKLT